MGKKNKTNSNNNKAAPRTNNRAASIAMGIVLLVVVAGCVVLWWWKTNQAQASSTAAALTQPVAAAKSDFEKLKGKWVRTDGGYVLEVRQVADDGKIDAAYLNPRPINVSKASASSEAGKTKVFIELRDRLYPGSYYTLVYDAGKDQLAGVYHHLAINRQFDVVFVRTK